MSTARFVQIHTLHSYAATLLNRDDAGLAKRVPFGGTERLRVSSQCLKRHWRKAEDAHALDRIDPGIGTSVRSRRVWHVEIELPLVAEGLSRSEVTAVLAAMQQELYGESKAAKAAKVKDAVIDLERNEIVVLGRKEIEYLKDAARRVVGAAGGDTRIVAAELKELRRNLHALKAGAGIDAAMFGRFVSGDRDARVDAAIHVAHAFTVHGQTSEPDYFTAVDDLPGVEQGSGAGHVNAAELTTGVYYGYVVVDVPLLVSNLEGCRRAGWLEADRTLAARTVEHLLHLVAKVTPGAKLGATAPYDWASLVLVETGNEQPRSLANAFLEPARGSPLDATAARMLTGHLAEIDGMYGSEATRRLATRFSGLGVPGAVASGFSELAASLGAAIRDGGG